MSRDYYNITPPEFLVDSRNEFGNNVRYELSPARIYTECPLCHSSNFIKHGKADRKARDLSEFSKLVGLIINGHRYQCKDCKGTWTDQFESIDENAKMTNRMREYVRDKALKEPFLRISKELDISVSSVKRVFTAYVTELDSKHKLVAPKVLGMDENFLNGSYRGMYVDIENCRVIDMTSNRKLGTVKKWLSELPEKERIECVTMDMWGPYKDAVRAILPDVPIIIDKFHVIKHVNEALDVIRKSMRDEFTDKERKYLKNSRWLMLKNSSTLTGNEKYRLTILLGNYPQFQEPYDLKESFRDVYACDTREDAEKTFAEWKEQAGKYPKYREVVDMIESWKTEVFNYFEYRYTNAATESLNHLAKEMAAHGRGYSFGVLRAKVLYGTKASQPARYSYYPDEETSADKVSLGTPIRLAKYANLVAGAGADINELIKAIERGEF